MCVCVWGGGGGLVLFQTVLFLRQINIKGIKVKYDRRYLDPKKYLSLPSPPDAIISFGRETGYMGLDRYLLLQISPVTSFATHVN